MTSSHDALYQAICSHPDEDTPRLAFADLIEEDGDSLRARFIRTQIALARTPPYDVEWVKARQYEPDSATGWGMAHTLPRPLPEGYGWQSFEFRRGFPWKVGVSSLASCVESGDAIFNIAPIHAFDIVLSDWNDLRVLAEWPQLARLRNLGVSVGKFGAEDITRLAESEHASNITELSFEHDGIAADGLVTLAASLFFRRLRSFELRSNTIPTPLITDALSTAREPGALSRLSLPHNDFDRDNAEHLFALPLMRHLQHLDMSDNRLGAQGVIMLAESGIVRGLRILDLSGTKPGVPGVKALTEAGGVGGLRMLDLSRNLLGPVAVKALANCDALRGLRVLNLANNLVGDAGALALAESHSLAGLLELDLRDADIGDAGGLALAESPCLESLLRLDLRRSDNRPFGKAAREALLARFEDRVCV